MASSEPSDRPTLPPEQCSCWQRRHDHDRSTSRSSLLGACFPASSITNEAGELCALVRKFTPRGGTLRQVLGDLEGHFQTLLVVCCDPRASRNGRATTVTDVHCRQSPFGDVITGEFDAGAARYSSRGPAGLEGHNHDCLEATSCSWSTT